MRKKVVLLFAGLTLYVVAITYIANMVFAKITPCKNENEQQIKLPTYWPLPVSIRLEPQKHLKDGQEIKYEYGSQERKDHFLLLEKENVQERKNQFIWKSNGNKRVKTITQKHEQPLKMGRLLKIYEDKADLSFIPPKKYDLSVLSHKGKVNIFEAEDDSGVVIIKHDGGVMACSDIGDNNGYYWDIRFDTKEIFEGVMPHFPPKPKGWCDPPSFQR